MPFLVDLLLSFCLEMQFSPVVLVGHDDGAQEFRNPKHVQIRGIVFIGVRLLREVFPAFARILLRTSLGKKYLVRPLLRTEITQVVNRRSWYDATKLTTEVLNLYKVLLCVEGWDEALHEIGAEDVLVSLKSFQLMASKLVNSISILFRCSFFVFLIVLQRPVLAEVHQRINPWMRQITRVYKGKEHAEVEFVIGPIPVDDGRGKEITTLISTTMKTNKMFYTDYNGQDFIKRNRDELQCRGSLDKVLKWYRWIAVYPTLKKFVNDMGFAGFCSINARNSDNRLIHALVERWWPSTHTFHFPCGKLGFTLLDFVMLTGISFGRGHELPYGEKYSKLEEVENMFSGITSFDMRYGNITLTYLKNWQKPLNQNLYSYDTEMDIVYARAFIAYMMGNLFFSNGATSLRAGYLVALTDYNILGVLGFDWGIPIMAALYRGLDEVSVLRPGKVKKSISRFYVVLEYWFFEYCRVRMYLVKRYDRMEGQNQHRLATMAQIYEIETSKGKSCFNAEHPEVSIGVSPIRPWYALIFKRPVYASDVRA
ncbi:hypothetical protein GIB67_032660 [Kingdonia uniflora]|uniref:Aminotransferase-like plant mobile domain-containing protein n=1 Tax=Kingdonia uniflora TaxID=39325 RepID=A0A7J7MVX6_9MAGN|nr:hypothetical protein GIB67_032660 [Kingdonia uniflora]